MWWAIGSEGLEIVDELILVSQHFHPRRERRSAASALGTGSASSRANVTDLSWIRAIGFPCQGKLPVDPFPGRHPVNHQEDVTVRSCSSRYSPGSVFSSRSDGILTQAPSSASVIQSTSASFRSDWSALTKTYFPGSAVAAAKGSAGCRLEEDLQLLDDVGLEFLQSHREPIREPPGMLGVRLGDRVDRQVLAPPGKERTFRLLGEFAPGRRRSPTANRRTCVRAGAPGAGQRVPSP